MTTATTRWLAAYPAGGVPIGRARTYGEGTDLTILTFANGLRMSLRVARRLERSDIRARVVDLRWLAPLPVNDMIREADATGRVLIVDETRSSGGVSEGILAALLDNGYTGAMARVASADSFIPLGDAALAGAAVRGHHRGRSDQAGSQRRLIA